MAVFVVPEFLSPAECVDAIGLFPPIEDGLINGGVADPRRRSGTSFLTLDTDEKRLLGLKFKALLTRANIATHHFFDISGVEPIQLARYEVGDQYQQHLDIGVDSDSARRKLSMSVQLSPANDYDGGDLDVWGTGLIDRAQGTAVVFPSYLVHEVKPVTRGTRLSLVAWATGTSPYR
jgi:PKHD-type hydroxylase